MLVRNGPVALLPLHTQPLSTPGFSLLSFFLISPFLPFLSPCVCVSRSVVSDSLLPHEVAHQAPLSVGFSRQEYWSGLPFPSPGDLPNPGIEPRSPALQADALLSQPPGKALIPM